MVEVAVGLVPIQSTETEDLTVGQRVGYGPRVEGGDQRCESVNPMGDASVAASSNRFDDGGAGLVTHSVAASFDYALIFEIGSP